MDSEAVILNETRLLRIDFNGSIQFKRRAEIFVLADLYALDDLENLLHRIRTFV